MKRYYVKTLLMVSPVCLIAENETDALQKFCKVALLKVAPEGTRVWGGF